DALQTRADLVHRLRVGDLLPPIRAPLTDPLQRTCQPIAVIVDLRCGGALVTDVPRQQGMLVRLDPGHAGVGHLGAYLAPDVADRADHVLDGCLHVLTIAHLHSFANVCEFCHAPLVSARRTQVERSASTRSKLIEAAIESLVELGWARTTAV